MSSLATLIYKIILSSRSKLVVRAALLVRKVILKFTDPIITISYNGFTLTQPFSHTIFHYQRLFPHYDYALSKIAGVIKAKSGFLNMLDIGANIGDTAIFTNIKEANYLLVEGEKSYASLIAQNIFFHYGTRIELAQERERERERSRASHDDNLSKLDSENHTKTLQNELDSEISESKAQESSNAQLKKANFRIILAQCFISDDIKSYEISTSDGSGKLLAIDNTKSTDSTIRLKSLDSVIFSNDFAPNFIKIDTDGFDFKVIRSGSDTLAAYKPALYFEWDKFLLEAQGEDPLSIFSPLARAGYERLIVFDNFGHLLCALDTNDSDNLALLLNYTKLSRKNIYYYDILIWHKDSPFCANDFITAVLEN